MLPDTNLTKRTIKILIPLAALIAVMCLCAFIGTEKISLKKVLEGPAQIAGDNIDYEILIGVRIPRIILAALIGIALATAGAVLQAVLRNPLAEPYILGISSGAGLGVITAILSGLSFSFWAGSTITLFAFAGSIFTVWLVWLIGYFAGRFHVTTLLLAGVVVNAFFSAVIMFLTSIAKSRQLRATILWLMGNITEKSADVLWFSGISILAGVFCLFTLAHKLNALSLGDNEAKGLGVNTTKTKMAAFALTAFITAVAVSLSGLIGFVGLIVPHAVRLIVGPDHRQLLPISALTGAIFLVIADTIARSIFGQEQLPVGVITAIAGGPFFLILLAKYSRKISWVK